MDPITASLIIGGVQTGVGALQRASANKRRREAMAGFRYEIPSAVSEQVQMAREQASQRKLPGEDIYRSRVESEMAKGIEKGESAAQTASDVLGMYAQMFGQKSDIEKDIMQRGAEYQAAQRQELQRTLGLMAEAEGQQFYYNKYLPFLSDMQMAGEMSAGGAANIAGGLQTAYSGWMNKWMMDQQNQTNAINNADTAFQLSRNKITQNSPYWQSQALPEGSWGNLGDNWGRTQTMPMPMTREVPSAPSREFMSTPSPAQASWNTLSPEQQRYLTTPGFYNNR